MNIHGKNKYEMLGKVSALGESESSRISGIPAAAAIFSDIKMIHKEIGLNQNIVKEGTKGKVVSKEAAQSGIVKNGLVFAGALYGYAANKNDEELLTFADVSTKTFHKLRDSEIPLFIEKLLDKADALGEELIPYGITAVKRTDARTKLNDYLQKFGSLNIGKGTKKSANETIDMLLNKADKKLRALDKLMLGFKESDPELYSQYNASRVIWDKGGPHKGAEIPQQEEAKG